MSSPFFFLKDIPVSGDFILTEETSKHVSQVLRMKDGDHIRITNGNGQTFLTAITSSDKKKTKVTVLNQSFTERPTPEITIALSLIKNTNRFEWFAEKATEIGVSAIIPLLCQRTEKTHFRMERMRSVLISAMLQSQQSWLPGLFDPMMFSDILKNEIHQQKFIAHCIPEDKKELKNVIVQQASKIILIGPEGDFTAEEIQQAIQHDYIPVSLGNNRLRTETAGIVASVLLK